MPQDAFTIFHTAKQLNSILKNARIDRINQPDKDSAVLYLRAQNQNKRLVVSSNAENARVAFTETQKEAPLQAPSFCMLLRKHLTHATIEDVSVIPFERIIKIVFNTKNELREAGQKILYTEIMGKYSNVILTEDGKILGAIKQSQSLEGLRPILPGVQYKLPLPQDKIELSDENASLTTLNNYLSGDFANYVFTTFKGVSKQTALEIVYRYFNKHEVDISDVKNCNIIDFYKHFKKFYEDCNLNPCLISNGGYCDFYVIDYLSVEGVRKYYNSISTLLDDYYDNKETKREFENKKRKLLSYVLAYEKKLKKKYQIALDKILSCKDMQNDRIFGELIISNLYRIKSGESKVELENFYSENYETVTINLDEKSSPKDNAERYFKKYSKKKKTVASVEPQVKELESSLAYAKSLIDEIEIATEINDFIEIEEELIEIGLIKSNNKRKQKRENKSTYRTYEYCGFEILVGKNNVQNTKLTTSAERNDVWLHTKDYHSAHVIIKTSGKNVPDKVLQFAAEICAYYSKASNSDKVPVDYTLKKFVKRPSGLPMGMVYYTDQKTVYVTPNRHEESK